MVRSTIENVGPLTEARGIGYRARIRGDWEDPPFDVQAAIDRRADFTNSTIPWGIMEGLTITDAGGLDITWTAGKIRQNDGTITSVAAGSDTCTDENRNFLIWQSGSTLALGVAEADHNTGEIGIGHMSCQVGDQWETHNEPIIFEVVPAFQHGLESLIPIAVASGMIVGEDPDGTNTHDVASSAGRYFHDAHDEHVVPAMLSRVDGMTRWFRVAGVWTNDNNAEIDTANYDDGTDLVAIPVNKWVQSAFFLSESDIHWVYGQEFFNTEAQAIAGAPPTLPPGLQFPCSTAYVYQANEAALAPAGDERWIDCRPLITGVSNAVITNHGSLQGLPNDDHTQYLLADGTRPLTATWDPQFPLHFDNEVQVKFGSTKGNEKAGMMWAAAGLDSWQWATKVASDGNTGVISLMRFEDLGIANRRPAANVPDVHLRIHSSDPAVSTDYIELFHDQTNAVLNAGDGAMTFEIAGTENMRLTADSLGLMTDDPGGISASDILDIRHGPDVGAAMALSSSVAITGRGSFIRVRRSRGAVDAPTTVISGNTIGGLSSHAYTNAWQNARAAIIFTVDGAPSGSTVPTDIQFSTGTSSRTVRMTVQSDGNVNIANQLLFDNVGISIEGVGGTRLELDAPNNINFMRNGVNQITLTSRLLTLEGAPTDVQIDWGTSGQMRLQADGNDMIRFTSTQLGFHGTLISRPDYTMTNVTTDRVLDADDGGLTLAKLADVVGTIVEDLIAYRLFQ